MNKPLVTVITITYNAKKYIDICAKSILDQTYQNIQWLVIDNGCTDGTSQILQCYAKKDKRVKIIINEDNYIKKPSGKHVVSEWKDVFNYVDGEYFATLDSDDFLDKNFIQKLMKSAIENDADIAVAGTMMFKEDDPRQKGFRIPPAFIGEPKEMVTDFAAFYGSFRPVWGKIFKMSTYREHRNYLHDAPAYLVNGTDTFFCLRFLHVARKVVCIHEVLHAYMIRSDSIYSSNFYAERWRCYDLLYYEAKKLLESWNGLTRENHLFLLAVHYESMRDCVQILAKTNVNIEEKLKFIQNIVTDEILRDSLSQLNDGRLADEIGKLMLDIVRCDEQELSENYYKYFIYRLYKANQLRISDQAVGPLCSILYFSALCDKDNSTQWGLQYFKEYEKAVIPVWMTSLFTKYHLDIIKLLKYPALFCNLINADFQAVQKIYADNPDDDYIRRINLAINSLTINQAAYDNILHIKNSIFKNFEQGNLEGALDELEKIVAIRIFDEEVIYFVAYLNMLIDNKNIASAYAYSGLVFYDSEPIRDLINFL